LLFTIPTKDEDFFKWQQACKKYVDIKRGMYLCSFHFVEEDIVRKRLLVSEGTVIGVLSSPLPFQHSKLFSITNNIIKKTH